MNDIKDYLNYNEETGIFMWIKRTSNRIKLFAPAGTFDMDGYINLSFKNKRLKAHRLAWYYVYGEMPTLMIDHIDGNKTNNAISNLRLATCKQNLQNLRNPYIDNKTGFLGVRAKSGKNIYFESRINIDGKSKYLGSYDTAEKAHNAYLEEKRKTHSFCTI